MKAEKKQQVKAYQEALLDLKCQFNIAKAERDGKGLAIEALERKLEVLRPKGPELVERDIAASQKECKFCKVTMEVDLVEYRLRYVHLTFL